MLLGFAAKQLELLHEERSDLLRQTYPSHKRAFNAENVPLGIEHTVFWYKHQKLWRLGMSQPENRIQGN